MGVLNLAEFAVKLGRAAVAESMAAETIVATAATMLASSAKGAIGTYSFGWAPLGPDAVARHGDTPLLETGALKASITHTSSGNEGWVTTNDPKAAWQEFGTSRGIPPRPFFGGAIQHEAGKIEAMAASVAGAAIAGAFGGKSELGELLHVAGHAAKDIAHEFRDTVEGDK